MPTTTNDLFTIKAPTTFYVADSVSNVEWLLSLLPQRYNYVRTYDEVKSYKFDHDALRFNVLVEQTDKYSVGLHFTDYVAASNMARCLGANHRTALLAMNENGEFDNRLYLVFKKVSLVKPKF